MLAMFALPNTAAFVVHVMFTQLVARTFALCLGDAKEGA